MKCFMLFLSKMVSINQSYVPASICQVCKVLYLKFVFTLELLGAYTLVLRVFACVVIRERGKQSEVVPVFLFPLRLLALH